jgi:hypothetical protein
MKKDELEIIVREDPKLMIMLRVASEEGAKRALQKVGLEDADATLNIIISFGSSLTIISNSSFFIT